MPQEPDFELPKAYDPQSVEEKWLRFWEKGYFFKADSHSKKPPYCIIMPPPNVTGVLHMGHALVSTLQDILIRHKRMQGYEALWLPGLDHAGISTQTVVERHLMATVGKRRRDYSREEFLEKVWQWKEEYGHRIVSQLRAMGASCDWSRLRFTMDDGNNKAVKRAFKKLFDDRLIYRGDYLVNWDPVTQTAIADDEVEYEERSSFLWHFRYPIEGSKESIVIATTRPETLLGDTAVAVHPKDERYAHLKGAHVHLPLVDRLIPIIADDFVDPTFGTGAVKITPAHDPNDYQMGLRHNLPMINILTPDGRINENGGRFCSLTKEEAREKVVEAMKELGLLVKIEPHKHRVGLSYRSKAVIEPYLSKQWFIRMSEFAKKLRHLVEDGQVRLIPPELEHTYFHWIDNLRDWCISRQLWWGHRIPVWHHAASDQMICFDGEGLPPEAKDAPEEWTQDEDVLDTWFSSALWPFSTLGWPEKTPDLEKFYPNSVLVTGHDILFFWVARMLFMGTYFMKKPPFPETFLHGLIYGKSYWREEKGGGIQYAAAEERKRYDEGASLPPGVLSKWEKMSKSKGNIIDPVEMNARFGTDAVRMALSASASNASQIDLDLRRFEEFKNFANKIWNGARFVFMNLGKEATTNSPSLTSDALAKGLDTSLLSLEDKWILSSLNRVAGQVNEMIDKYAFDQAAQTAYNFFWNEFCAYYVELVKPTLFGKRGDQKERENKQKLLVIVLTAAIRLLHPMAPFITEEVFSKLKERFGNLKETHADPYTHDCVQALRSPACAVAPYPKVLVPSDRNKHVEETFALIGNIVYVIRNVRGEMKLPPGMATDLYLVGSGHEKELVEKNSALISALVPIATLHLLSKEPDSHQLMGTASAGTLKVLIPLPEELREKERERLQKERGKLQLAIEKATAQLENEAFRAKAPPPLIEKHETQLKQLKLELKLVDEKLQA